MPTNPELSELLARLDERLAQLSKSIERLEQALDRKVSTEQHEALVARVGVVERRVSNIERLCYIAVGVVGLLQWAVPIIARLYGKQ